ncbi:MAG: PAS domain-containing protein [Herminiimonas sp.]|nr:PAS domain-containing protein [Herminiimonas sp.]
MEFFRYKGRDVSTMLNEMPKHERDDLPYGIIKLDRLGTILEFNMTESAITGRSVESVIGKNFFTDVAPCTKTPEFYGKFVEGFEKRFLNTVFDYLFDHEMVPVRVKVHMVYAASGSESNVWVIVKRVLGQ